MLAALKYRVVLDTIAPEVETGEAGVEGAQCDTLEDHTWPLTLWKEAGKLDEHSRSNPHTHMVQLKTMKRAMVGGTATRPFALQREGTHGFVHGSLVVGATDTDIVH